MSNFNSALFCTDSSMESVILSPVQSQVSQARFPPIRSSPDIGRESNVAVVYSSDYSAKTSIDELFDPNKVQQVKPMRQRILPITFFDQSSASSSTSHSRDSLDSSHLNSPKRMSTAPNEVGSNHLSLKKNAKAKPMDPLMAFDSKTRSLPCSFSPSKFDPNMNPNSTLPTSNSNLNPNLNKIQLESFTQLQRGIMNQSRKTNDSTAVSATSVSAVSNNLGPNIIFNINTSNSPCQGHVFQHLPVNLNQNLHLSQSVMPLQTQQVQYSHLVNPALQGQSKKNNTFMNLAELEKERAQMRQRQFELVQAKLIGANRGSTNPTRQVSQTDNYRAQQQLAQGYGQNVMIKPQSESIDSGLDLLCYSSSTESTNRVSPELFMQLGNPSTLLAAANQNDTMQPYGNNQFGPSVTHKMVTSPSTVRATVSAGLFNSNHDLVTQTTNQDNFDRLKQPSVTDLKSDAMSSVLGSNFLSYPTNREFDEYESMSITSSPAMLDTSGGLNQENESNRLGLGNIGDGLNLSQIQPYEDNFIASILNGNCNESDFFDFNSNFAGLSGHGGADASDLHGFSYNL